MSRAPQHKLPTSLKRQRGFLLNPYRFAGTVQQGAFSADGVGLLTLAGASVNSSVLSAAGSATVIVGSDQVSAGALSSDGAGALTVSGASLASGAVSSDGAGALTAASDAVAITVDAADFDGTNDYLTRGAGLTGAADSKSGILSVWVRLDGGDAADLQLLSGDATGTDSAVARDSANKFSFLFVNAAGTNINFFTSTASYVAGATWRHVLASWDLAVPVQRLYITDVSDLNSVVATNDTIDYTLADWRVGALILGAGSKFNGALAEYYFAPGQYLDFSVEANRRKFISASGKPVSLGATGSLPTGTSPLVYLHLDDGESAANFAINRGTGGNFTVTGTLDTASSSPSD